jgi:diguanylate cyclase (GGDEF)-like protein
MNADAPAPPSASRRERWAAAGAIVIAFLLLLNLRAGLSVADRRLGVSYDLSPAGIELIGVAPGLGADRAGLERGDLLLSIDGQPLADSADFDRIANGFQRGEPVRVELARGEERLVVEVVPGADYDWRAFLLNAVAWSAYLGLGLLAAGRRADDFRSTLLAGFCFAVALELALPINEPIGGGAGLATQVAYLLVTGLQFGLDLHLAALLPTRPPWLAARPYVVRTFYLVGLSLGLFAAAGEVALALGLEGAEPVRDLGAVIVVNWLLPIWALLIAGIFGYRSLHHPEPRGRHQVQLVLLGVLPWVAVVWIDTVRPWLDPEAGILSSAVWNFALLAYPVAVFVAIYLYRLFDLELVVRKSFLYGTVTSLLVLGFYGLVGAIGALFAQEFGSEGVPFWVLSMAGLTMGLLFNPLRARVQSVIDRRLFPERQALRSRLVALAAELPAQGKLPRMGEHLVRELARIFAADSVTLWISAPPQGQLLQLSSTRRSDGELERTALMGGDDPAIQLLARSRRPVAAATLSAASLAMAQRLAEVEAELVVPLLAQEKLVGLLAFGRKREGQRYVAEELELLTLVGHLVATVFENARLFDSATFEGLTGLYRREALLEILDREWSRSQRYERPLAVALADLDHFKEVNDAYGHLAGDLVLQRIAAELRQLLRETDFIGRYGGEEFLIVLPETTLDGARSFAEKIRQRIEELEIAIEGKAPVRITLSIGVASREEIRSDPRVRARALIAAADEALYAAKNRGRNRVEEAAAKFA